MKETIKKLKDIRANFELIKHNLNEVLIDLDEMNQDEIKGIIEDIGTTEDGGILTCLEMVIEDIEN